MHPKTYIADPLPARCLGFQRAAVAGRIAGGRRCIHGPLLPLKSSPDERRLSAREVPDPIHSQRACGSRFTALPNGPIRARPLAAAGAKRLARTRKRASRKIFGRSHDLQPPVDPSLQCRAAYLASFHLDDSLHDSALSLLATVVPPTEGDRPETILGRGQHGGLSTYPRIDRGPRREPRQ